jgi:hypothetical protein
MGFPCQVISLFACCLFIFLFLFFFLFSCLPFLSFLLQPFIPLHGFYFSSIKFPHSLVQRETLGLLLLNFFSSLLVVEERPTHLFMHLDFCFPYFCLFYYLSFHEVLKTLIAQIFPLFFYLNRNCSDLLLVF